MYGYKVYINAFLYHIGLRHILPSAIINNKPIKECYESLEKFENIYVRKTVAKMLRNVQSILPKDYSLCILCGYRSIDEQINNWNKGIKKLKKIHPDWNETKIINANRKMNADPRRGFGPHQTGAAVDVTLLYKHEFVDMGGQYNSGINSVTKTKNLTTEQKYNRNILITAMTKAGFQNYPNEWWHWSFGDKSYAAYKHKKFAVYGKI